MSKVNSATRLEVHILKSYSALRWTMAVLGLFLPPFLTIGGVLQFWWLKAPLPIQTSLSAYYHAGGGCMTSYGVYRNLFVGILCVIAVCLVIYSGFSKLEDRLLNLSGVALILVAMFPTAWSQSDLPYNCEKPFIPFIPSTLLGTGWPIHYVSAIIFFVLITLVNVLTAEDSIRLIEDEDHKRKWHLVFQVARWLMPISLLLSAILAAILDPSRIILWIEWGGIWGFSLYWLFKSLEILETKVDLDMVSGAIDFAHKGTRRLKRDYTN